MKEKVAALVADGFQDSEYFLPKIALQDQLGLDVEVVSTKKEPIEIYSYFRRIGVLDVDKSIIDADANDYIGVLVPGGAKSPALLAENPAIIAFLRQINDEEKLVASICRGSLLVAKSGIAKGRHLPVFTWIKSFQILLSNRSSSRTVVSGATISLLSLMQTLYRRAIRMISRISLRASVGGCPGLAEPPCCQRPDKGTEWMGS